MYLSHDRSSPNGIIWFNHKISYNKSDHLYTEFITFPFYLTVVENITK